MIILANTKYIYLGNKIILYSGMMATAKDHGFKLYNPSFAPYSKHFDTTLNDFWCRYPIKASRIKGSQWWRDKTYQFFYYLGRFIHKFKLGNRLIDVLDIGWDGDCDVAGEEFVRLAKSRKVLILQGWGYHYKPNMLAHADQARAYFTPRRIYREHIQPVMENARQGIDVLVGVHIRQGDFKTFLNGKYYYTTPEYATVMRKMQGFFPDKKVRFLVCSNEKQALNDFEGLDVVFGPDHPVEDMYALAACDYLFGPPSTFSFWASFYGAVPYFELETLEEQMTLEKFRMKVL